MTGSDDTVDDHLPEDVRDLRPSARHVYRELMFADGALTMTDLQHRSGLSLQTIRRAVTALEEIDRVESRWDLDDARRRCVRISHKSRDSS